MTQGQKLWYEMLQEEDKSSKKNTAKKYLESIKKEKQNKVTVFKKDEICETLFNDTDKINKFKNPFIKKSLENDVYKALLESDKITGLNEAKEYLNKKNNENITISEENQYSKIIYKAIPLIITISILILIPNPFKGNSIEENGLIILIGSSIIFGMIWLYSLISILSNNFKKDVNKTVWILAIIFIPPTCIIYPFFDNQIEK